MNMTLSNTDIGAGAASDTAAAPGAMNGARIWTGRILSGLVVLFLAFDIAIKLSQSAEALKGTAELGYPISVVFPLGLILLGCLVLHLVPRTAIVGAVLLTGYLGGAIATHVRVENPLFSHVLFPIYVAALIWGGLYLRDERVAMLLGRRKRT